MRKYTHCRRCGQPIPPHRFKIQDPYRVRYCSHECADEHHRTQKRAIPLPSATVGALSELIVAADLLRRGCEVFRAVSPSCSCDLIALIDGKAIRIESRTAYVQRSGEIAFALKPRDAGRSDIIAAVLEDQDVFYFPDPYGWNEGQVRFAPYVAKHYGHAPDNR